MVGFYLPKCPLFKHLLMKPAEENSFGLGWLGGYKPPPPPSRVRPPQLSTKETHHHFRVRVNATKTLKIQMPVIKWDILHSMHPNKET